MGFFCFNCQTLLSFNQHYWFSNTISKSVFEECCCGVDKWMSGPEPRVCRAVIGVKQEAEAAADHFLFHPPPFGPHLISQYVVKKITWSTSTLGVVRRCPNFPLVPAILSISSTISGRKLSCLRLLNTDKTCAKHQLNLWKFSVNVKYSTLVICPVHAYQKGKICISQLRWWWLAGLPLAVSSGPRAPRGKNLVNHSKFAL